MLVFIGVAIFTVAIYRAPYFSIKTISVSGDSDDRVASWLEALKGRSIFSREVSTLTRRITNQNLFVNSLTCSRGLPDSLRCFLGKRTVGLVWQKQARSYLVDENGLVFAENPGLTGKVIVDDQTAAPVDLGSRVASSELISSYRQIAAKLQPEGLTCERIVIPETLLQVNAVVGPVAGGSKPISLTKPITVMFNLAYSLDDQVRALVELLGQRGSAITERVDLRVAGKIYYK